jgi:hypothetical protein
VRPDQIERALNPFANPAWIGEPLRRDIFDLFVKLIERRARPLKRLFASADHGA